jgi:hypothetical protein
MAINTAERRRSAGSVASVPFIPGVTPNSSKDSEWRQQSGWSYSGIDADTPVVSVTPTENVNLDGRNTTFNLPGRSTILNLPDR